MSACEECWTEACWLASLSDDATVDIYMRLITETEHPHPGQEDT